MTLKYNSVKFHDCKNTIWKHCVTVWYCLSLVHSAAAAAAVCSYTATVVRNARSAISVRIRRSMCSLILLCSGSPLVQAIKTTLLHWSSDQSMARRNILLKYTYIWRLSFSNWFQEFSTLIRSKFTTTTSTHDSDECAKVKSTNFKLMRLEKLTGWSIAAIIDVTYRGTNFHAKNTQIP